MRAVLVAVLVLCAAAAAAAAHDVRAWERAVERGDASFGRTPARARWEADTMLPGDPVGRALDLADDIELRGAVQAFAVARGTPRGFDNGERRAHARAAALVALTDVTARGSRRQVSQAQTLLGVLAASGGRIVGGVAADDRSHAAFDAAVRADPANTAAKYDLELLLRRTRATAARQGPGTGAGGGGGRRGAGSGTPGRGY